jgi:long-chain acyl-CoA synthetase
MLDLKQYDSLGAALRDALDRWPDEICLIEADRERERSRLTYRQFREASEPLAAALEDSGFAAGERAAIIMTNQPKWLISAYATFFAGGVLVPLDYKLSADEHLQLLAHSKVRVLFVEYPHWRAITQAKTFREHELRTILVTEAPPDADLAGGLRWEEYCAARTPEFRPRSRKETACIVYSSGTGGRPKGCVLTHENYLEQCGAVTPIFPFQPGARYLSIIPTNHAIDFMGGFIMPFTGGGTVIHLRTLRPEFIRDAFTRYRITYMAVVPLILKNLQRGLRERFAALPPGMRRVLNALIRVNRAFTRRQPRLGLSRLLMKDVHQAFGGELRALLVGGAFTEPAIMEFFHDLGIPIYNGYGCTEACTAITVNDLRPFRPETVGRAVRGMEIRIVEPDADGIGEVAVRSKTVMSHYLDDPEMTAETIVDGWLMTGDLGRVDAGGHLQLFGRKKNMIVTAEGKNIYPEDIENTFEGIPVKEFSVFAANYIWPRRTMAGEQLVLVLHPEPGQNADGMLRVEISRRNMQLLNYKRVAGYVIWERDFPRNAGLKIKRMVLAEQIREQVERDAMVAL